jgi:hypothetical protein
MEVAQSFGGHCAVQKIDSERELRQLQKSGHGYIYNDFSPSGASHEGNILHVASCRTLHTANMTYDKYFAQDQHAAEAWLRTNRGDSWHYCGTCLS